MAAGAGWQVVAPSSDVDNVRVLWRRSDPQRTPEGGSEGQSKPSVAMTLGFCGQYPAP